MGQGPTRPRDGLRWTPSGARPMHDVKIKRLQLHDPPCYYSFWLLEVTEPSETGMVCHHREVAASQVVLKELYICHDRQQLLVGSTIMPLTRIECLGGICDNTLDYLPALFLLLSPYSCRWHP